MWNYYLYYVRWNLIFIMFSVEIFIWLKNLPKMLVNVIIKLMHLLIMHEIRRDDDNSSELFQVICTSVASK